MRRRPPRSTRTDTRCPYATRFRSLGVWNTYPGCDLSHPAFVLASFKRSLEMRRQFVVLQCLRIAPNFKTHEIVLAVRRSEEHTSELQSLMRISYAVFCLNKKNTHNSPHYTHILLPTPTPPST